ncbi:hypothetical protein CF319_g7535 [Tilletia indica]|nr:hypothetical protein CF319_g7535 [Tilletia indica]
MRALVLKSVLTAPLLLAVAAVPSVQGDCSKQTESNGLHGHDLRKPQREHTRPKANREDSRATMSMNKSWPTPPRHWQHAKTAPRFSRRYATK